MKNNNKNMHLFAIAALAATLMAGQVSVSPAYAESTSVVLSSLIPDNVTVEQPMPLSDISLPDSEYGTLSWVDSSSVPSERVQSYDVVFKPYDSSVLSKISGWDGESDAIYSTVTVVVSGMESNSEESDEWNEDSSENYDENYNDSETENDENQDNYDENQDSSDSITATLSAILASDCSLAYSVASWAASVMISCSSSGRSLKKSSLTIREIRCGRWLVSTT